MQGTVACLTLSISDIIYEVLEGMQNIFFFCPIKNKRISKNPDILRDFELYGHPKSRLCKVALFFC